MRFIIIGLAALLTACTSTTNQTSTVQSAPQSSATALSTQSVGGDTLIQIPADWQLKSSYMPADLNASNIRITAYGVKIALTGFHKTGKKMMSEQELTDLLKNSTTPYLGVSTEQAFNPVNVTTAKGRVAYVTYTAADPEQGLHVLLNEHSLQVTTAIYTKDDTAFSISISVNKSDAQAKANHLKALEALKTLQ